MDEINQIKSFINWNTYVFKNRIVQHRFFIGTLGASSAIGCFTDTIVIVPTFYTTIFFFPFQLGQDLITGLLIWIFYPKFFKIHFLGKHPIIGNPFNIGL
ncbi:hypothetical protein D3C81_1566280 [compost metagenome]